MGYGSESEQAAIELTENYGVDYYDQGSGFGHIALEVDDAAAACAGSRHRRHPCLARHSHIPVQHKMVREAGPMKHGSPVIAFVEDPDGYRIELIQKKAPA